MCIHTVGPLPPMHEDGVSEAPQGVKSARQRGGGDGVNLYPLDGWCVVVVVECPHIVHGYEADARPRKAA